MSFLVESAVNARAFKPSAHVTRSPDLGPDPWKGVEDDAEAAQVVTQQLRDVSALIERNPSHRGDWSALIDAIQSYALDHFTEPDMQKKCQGWCLHDLLWYMLAHLYCVDEVCAPHIARSVAWLDQQREEYPPSDIDPAAAAASASASAPKPKPQVANGPLMWTEHTFKATLLVKELRARLLTYHWVHAEKWYLQMQIPPKPQEVDPATKSKQKAGVPIPVPPLLTVFDTRRETQFGKALAALTHEQLLYACAAYVVKYKRNTHIETLGIELVMLCGRLHHAVSVSKWLEQTAGHLYDRTYDTDEEMETSRTLFHTWLCSQTEYQIAGEFGKELHALLSSLMSPATFSTHHLQLDAKSSEMDPLKIKLGTVIKYLCPEVWCAGELMRGLYEWALGKPEAMLDQKKDPEVYDAYAFFMFTFMFTAYTKLDFLKTYVRINEEVESDMKSAVNQKAGYGIWANEALPMNYMYGGKRLVRFRADWIAAACKLDLVLHWNCIVMREFDGLLDDQVTSIKPLCEAFYIALPPPPPAPPEPEPLSTGAGSEGAVAAAASKSKSKSPLKQVRPSRYRASGRRGETEERIDHDSSSSDDNHGYEKDDESAAEESTQDMIDKRAAARVELERRSKSRRRRRRMRDISHSPSPPPGPAASASASASAAAAVSDA